MSDNIIDFWNTAQQLYSQILGMDRLLDEEEWMLKIKLGSMLKRYYTLQRYVINRDIKRWEQYDDETHHHHDNDDDDDDDDDEFRADTSSCS